MPAHAPTRRQAQAFLRRARVALAAALVGASLAGIGALPPVVRAETPTPGPVTGPTVLGETITFFGRGYGHGVGMSQYGARGRALAGQDAATILAHYYEGTTLAALDPATRIRVLVLPRWSATAAHPLVISGRLTPWTIDGIGLTFPPDARLRLSRAPIAPAGMWRLVVDVADGSTLYDGPPPPDIVVRAATDDGRLQVSSKRTSFNLYRGLLHVIVRPTTATVSVVNDVALEAYLGGVVPVEMPSTWPAAALQAQAIAARSFAARLRSPGSYFDVRDDSSSQIYRGVAVERATTNAAIVATTGQVLMSDASIANALFDSTGGGATESNENVFTTTTGRKVARPVSYLRGSSDRAPDGTVYDASSPFATWSTRSYARSELSTWFAADARTNVGELLALDLNDRGVSGRLVSVMLIGSAGSRRVSGAVFRAIFNAARPAADPSLRSTLFDLAPIP